MKIVDIAQEIFKEIGEPSSSSIPAIAFWLRANLGQLNNYTGESFHVDNSYEIINLETNEEINEEAVAIFKKMYFLHDYDLKIRANIISISSSDIISISDKGRQISKINKNEVIKALASLKREEQVILNKLIHSYKNREASPIQVVGDDTQIGIYNKVKPYNRII
jgi:hypothetical protein